MNIQAHLKKDLHFQKHIYHGKGDILFSGWHQISFEIREPDDEVGQEENSLLILWVLQTQACELLAGPSSKRSGEGQAPRRQGIPVHVLICPQFQQLLVKQHIQTRVHWDLCW